MTSGVAPGWYADAVNPAVIRWWDGVAWSEHTQPNPSAPSAPVVSAPTASAPVAATGALPLPSAPYVPPPFADPAPTGPVSTAPVIPVAAAPAPTPTLALPVAATPARPTAAPLSSAPYSPPLNSTPYSPALGSASTPGSRRPSAKYLPVSEPVRLVPPSAGSSPSAGFPGFDEPVSASPAGQSPAYPGVQTTAPPPTGVPWSTAAPFTGATTFAQPQTASVDLASVDYEPMTRTWGSQRGAGSARVATGSSTGGSWMLALSPVLLLGLGALGWWLTDGATAPTTPYVLGGLAALSVLWIVVGAITDFRRLGALGHEHRASVAWIIAGPFFYLLVRGIHVHRTLRGGTAPTWVFVVLMLIVAVGASALSLFLPRSATLTELRGVETQLASDMLLQGLTYTVQCPSETSAAIGSSFVCTAYDEIGPAALIRVTWTGLGEFDYAIE